MVSALEQIGIIPLQFKLDAKRPDLTKLDSLLGLLASESTYFPKQVQQSMLAFKDDGLKGMTTRILAPRKQRTVIEKGKDEEIKVSSIEQKEVTKTVEEKKVEASLESKEVEVEEKKEEASSQFCVICEEKPVQCALLECGHLNFCVECSTGLKECPICRAPVVRTLRVYQN